MANPALFTARTIGGLDRASDATRAGENPHKKEESR